jgi:glycosyltransferase involved in cell wall biosynthesis
VKSISILTGSYNEEENVEELYERVRDALHSVGRYEYEHIFIDNASTDGTVAVLKRIAARDRNIKVIVNARNYGAIRSTMHVINQASGDAVIGIVADLQDPPELIPELIERWEQGYAMVLCIKRSSQEHSLMFWLRQRYYELVRRLSSIETFEGFSGFGLYDRRVIEAVKAMKDPYPYFRGLIAEIALPHYKVFYDQPQRKHGSSKHNFYTLYDTAMLGVTQLSKVPLRFVTFLGFASSALCVCVGVIYLIYKLLFWKRFSLGIAPVAIGMFFFSSVQLVSLGIIGEYVGLLQTQVQRRPYVVELERVNFDSDLEHVSAQMLNAGAGLGL